MIIIQFFLIAALIFLMFNFIRSRATTKTQAYKKVALTLFIMCAIVVVIFPDISTSFATLLGIGRGADLLLYGLTIVVIFQLLNTYIKDKEEQKKTNILSRKIAIIEARLKESNPKLR